MSTSTVGTHPDVAVVGVEDLVCPGCAEPVAGMPPTGWPVTAGRAPEFSHRDGSVLCPDSTGRVGEPVEDGGTRFWLTEAGDQALADGAGDRR